MLKYSQPFNKKSQQWSNETPLLQINKLQQIHSILEMYLWDVYACMCMYLSKHDA